MNEKAEWEIALYKSILLIKTRMCNLHMCRYVIYPCGPKPKPVAGLKCSACEDGWWGAGRTDGQDGNGPSSYDHSVYYLIITILPHLRACTYRHASTGWRARTYKYRHTVHVVILALRDPLSLRTDTRKSSNPSLYNWCRKEKSSRGHTWSTTYYINSL